MPTNGVRWICTVVLLIAAACQSPAREESIYASSDSSPSGLVGGLRSDAASVTVEVPPTPPRREPADPQARGTRPSVALAQRALRQFNYDQTPLEDVLDDISQIAGVNIVVNWRSLGDHNITRRTPVSLNLTGVSMAKVLDVLTDELSGGRDKFGAVYWLVEEGLVRIATGSALNTTLDTRVFDVGDLLMLVPSFAGPRLNLDMSGNVYESMGEGADGVPSRVEAQEMLIELVKDTIGEDMWQPVGKGSVSIRGEQMIVTQTRLGWLLMRRR